METFTSCPILLILFAIFLIGEVLLISGYRKYNYSLAWVLLPFAGVIFSIPVYFGLKENFYKKGGDAAMANVAHKQLVVGIWFVVAIIVWLLISGVITFLPTMSTGDLDAGNWARLTSIGLGAICLIYITINLLLKKK